MAYISEYWFMVPPVLIICSFFNLVFVGVFGITGEKKFMWAFIGGFALMVLAAAAVFGAFSLWFPEHLHGIRFTEDFL